MTLYRLQLNRGMRFADAAGIVDYLDALGVTEAYVSPCLLARRDSPHGYDISDHSRLNPELGDESDLAGLVDALRARGMGLVMDLVPNHMGVDTTRNRWWRDVLENGRSSPHARAFDIDWTPVKREMDGKVLLPILDDQYGAVLERGGLTLRLEEGALVVEYYDHRLPIDPRSAVRVLGHDRSALDGLPPDQRGDADELRSILNSLEHLPTHESETPDAIMDRQREKEVARRRLVALLDRAPGVRAHVEGVVAAWNGTPGDPASFDRLHELLEAQHYRLAYWRTAADEINYRRFFDINDLAGIRMEDDEVFDAAHSLVLKLVGSGAVTGLRLDHPDGLFDPVGYTARLQARIAEHGVRSHDPERPLYVTVEKILSPGELLLTDWAVHGTTTYRFLNLVNNLFVEGGHAVTMQRFYQRITGNRESFEDLVYGCKKLIMTSSMASELNVLAHALNDLSESDRRSRDFTLSGLQKALLEVIACFPIYRTYVSPRGISLRDRTIIEQAIAEARRRNPALEATIFEFVRGVLIPPDAEGSGAPVDPIGRARRLAFAMKFQQYTGPVHAKGVEDTAFYRHNMLVSLNEVGGDPQHVGRTPDEFHAANLLRQQRWPLEMIGTSTHDTKRGEDVRARINVLSEIPDDWRHAVSRFGRITGPSRVRVLDEPAPDRNDEYLFYQSLLGIWPAEPLDAPVPERAPDGLVERIAGYMQKAIKEAKVHTSWVAQDEAYETALRSFVERALTGPAAPAFLRTFVPFARMVARIGMFNALSQLVLKLTAPGVVDCYQGSELWELSLVDPDNRRPVDFALRRRLLDELGPLLAETDPAARTRGVEALLADWPDGRIKMFVLASLLRERRERRDLFIDGTYEPLHGTDERSRRHIVSFARRHGYTVLTVAVPRLLLGVLPDRLSAPLGEPAWGQARLRLPEDLRDAEGVNLLTHERVTPHATEEGPDVAAADLFRHCPVALVRWK